MPTVALEGATNNRAGAALLTLVLLANAAFVSPAPATATLAPSPAAALPARATTTVPFATTLTESIAPGVVHRSGTWTTTSGSQAVELVDVALGTPGISVESSVAASGVRALQTVSAQAARATREGHRVVAAINGDTWATDTATGQRSPTGLAVSKGQVLTGTTKARPTLGFDSAGIPRVGDVSLAAAITMPDGVTILPIDRINKPRPAGTLVLYTRAWGTRTGTPVAGTEVVLTGAALPIRVQGSWTATVASVTSSIGNSVIRSGTIVLSARGADEAVLKTLTAGARVTITTSITAGWEDTAEAISGREWLVRDGGVSVSPVSATTMLAHPRTAVGVRDDGSLILGVVDGRQAPYSTGVTANDLAELLVEQGVRNAINLDGGGSTVAVARRPGDAAASLINRPSDGVERSVDEALLIVSSIPTGPLADIVVRPSGTTAVVGQVVPFQAKGVDAARNAVPLAAAAVTWSATGPAGSVTPSGRFSAATPGSAEVTAATANLATTTLVAVVPDTIAPVPAAPVVKLAQGAVVAPGAVAVTVGWAAATDVGTGVAKYELQQQVDTGAWTDVPLATALTRSVAATIVPGVAVSYRVRATDAAANVSGWKAGFTFQVRLLTESAAKYAGTWAIRARSSSLGGKDKVSRVAGATATYSFTGSSIAWIAPRYTTNGSAKVLVDGRAISTINLRSSASQPQRAVFSYSWSAIGRHKITVRVSGTAGHPWVPVDGFAVIDVASPYPTLSGAGDIASCALTGDSATAALLDRTPGTIFAAGDLAYEYGTALSFKNCYGPTWGGFKGRTQPVPGNHDYGTAGAVPYFAYFGPRVGTRGNGWYAYNVGTWRIYSLNSNCAYIGGCGVGSAQEAWLKADLAAHPTACVAAIWHHPLFSSGVHGNSPITQALWQDLYNAGAELVINGHDHDYERFAPQRPDGTADPLTGIREFVVGTGGASLRPFSTIRANSEVRKTGVYGIIRFTLLEGSYLWKFVPVAGSSWTDSGSGTCH